MSVLSLVCVLLTTKAITFEADIVKYDIRAIEAPSSSPTVEYVYTAVTVDGEIVEYMLDDNETCTLTLKEQR